MTPLLLIAMLLGLYPSRFSQGAQPGWEVVSHDVPALAWANRLSVVRLRLRTAAQAGPAAAQGDRLVYRWLAGSGHDTVEGPPVDLPQRTATSSAVELPVAVRGPGGAGAWMLEWAVVRAGADAAGPPESLVILRAPVWVLWRCGVMQIAFVAGTLGLLAVLRHRPPPSGSPLWAAVSVLPALWLGLAAGLVASTFAELAGEEPFAGAGGLAASGAAMLTLAVLAVPCRWRGWAAFAVAAAASLTAFADLPYLRYFGGVIPLVALPAAGQIGQAAASVRALLNASDAWLLLTIVAGIGVGLMWPARESCAASRRSRVIAAAAGACLAAAASLPALRTIGLALSDSVFSEQLLVRRWGVLNVHLFDVARTLRERLQTGSLPAGERARIASSLAARAAAVAPSQWFGVARGANLLLIQVESLQQWVVGARVDGVEITPFLDSLRSRALYFPYVFDETEWGRSSDGEFTALNSQLPMTRGAVVFRRASNHFVALPGILKQHGYATMSAHPFERGFWNRAVVHPRYGFDRMMFDRELGPGEVIGWGLADGVFFARVAPELAKLPQPFFAMLITLGLHHPFDQFPDRHKVLDVGTLKDTPLGNYIHAMHYFDASLAALLADLGRAGLLRNTVVALYGDHEAGLKVGPELLALAGVREMTPATETMLWRVPFLVLLPGGALAGERPVPGGHIDIAPTLLDLLGIERPRCFIGASLLGPRPFPAYIRGGSAVAGEQLFTAIGERIPVGGACFAFPSGAPLPRASCDSLAGVATEERKLSQAIVEHDLAEALERGS